MNLNKKQQDVFGCAIFVEESVSYPYIHKKLIIHAMQSAINKEYFLEVRFKIKMEFRFHYWILVIKQIKIDILNLMDMIIVGKKLFKTMLKDGKLNIILIKNKMCFIISGKKWEKNIVKLMIQNLLKININIKKYTMANIINRAQKLLYQMNHSLWNILVNSLYYMKLDGRMQLKEQKNILITYKIII